ncbi:MAG: hypothetical protein ACI9OJ_002330 [Myxococcota bacterium]|jgi:hypothetical protein
MPPIALSRAPLQRIVEQVEPERIRPNARNWEGRLTEHRQLLRAEHEARVGLVEHYRHEFLLSPLHRPSLEAELASQQALLDRRFRTARRKRVIELRHLEATILSAMGGRGMGPGPGTAEAAILRAEIGLARLLDSGPIGSVSVGSVSVGSVSVGPVPADGKIADSQVDLRRRVLGELERAAMTATTRLSRERAAQLQAVVLEYSGETRQALKVIEASLAKGVSWTIDSELRNRQGDYLLGMRRFSAAARGYGRVGKRDIRWYIRARLGLAWCRYRTGDDDGALAALRQVRARLDGLYGSRARAVGVEANRLWAQLLAETTGGRRRKAERNAPPALLAAAAGLRAARVVVEPTATGDGRLKLVAERAPAMRECFRSLIRERSSDPDVEAGRIVLLLGSASPPRILQSTVGGETFKSCVTKGVSSVERLPDDRTALVVVELSEVMQ